MGHTVLANGTHSPCYGTRSPGKWDAQSLLWDTHSWQMGRAVSIMGHTVLANGTRSPCYGTRSPGKWDAQPLLWDTHSWQMGRAVSIMGHTVLATGTHSLCYGTRSPRALEDAPCKSEVRGRDRSGTDRWQCQAWGWGAYQPPCKGPACRPWAVIGRAVEGIGASVAQHRRGSSRIFTSVASRTWRATIVRARSGKTLPVP